MLLLFWMLGLVGSTHRANAAARLQRTMLERPAHSQVAENTVVWGAPALPKVTGLITNVRWGLHD
jgi:hypothetical protein